MGQSIAGGFQMRAVVDQSTSNCPNSGGIGETTGVTNVFFESVRHFLWNEDKLHLFSAFGISDEYVPIFDVVSREFRDLTHPHATTYHEFEDKTVPLILCSEDNFIYDILFQDFPMNSPLFFENLPQNRRIARILKVRIIRGFDKVEEGRNEP